MTASLGPAPAGGPGWLNALWIILAVLVAVFGRGFGTALAAAVRNMRAGLATRESEARQQEREFRAAERQASEEHHDRVYQRMDEQLQAQGVTILAQGREIAELREAVRKQYEREQQMMAGLTHHAGWDFIVKPYLPDDFPEPPPLLPPRDQAHTVEWGTSPG